MEEGAGEFERRAIVTYFMDRDELTALLANASWFAGYYVRWKKIGPERFRVKTNYAWVQA
jgi:hypothetical protein